MQSYNTILQSNNTDLQTILNTINNLPSGAGSSDNEDAYLSGTLSGKYTNSRVTTIGSYAFTKESAIIEVEFPNCETISYAAFGMAENLVTASFPNCAIVNSAAFTSCGKLQSVFLPNCTTIGSIAFNHCYSFTNVTLPVCGTIGKNAFYSCINLAQISLPACRTIDEYAFGRCSNLTSVSLPACTLVSKGAFNECWNLAAVNLPVCETIGDMGIRKCYMLSDIRIGTSKVCTLNASTALEYTPYAGYSSSFSGTPHIYVPTSLITTYQSATNWVYYSSYFSSIESLEEELISFTINGVEYKAENGMTWEEWFDSEYSSDYSSLVDISGSYLKCTKCDNYLTYPEYDESGGWVDDAMAIANDKIAANAEYTTMCDCNIITFKINSTQYEAEKEMTWGEWVESEYNTNNYFVDGEYVYGGIINGMPYQDVLYEYAGSRITINDTIIADHNYFTSGMIPL